MCSANKNSIGTKGNHDTHNLHKLSCLTFFQIAFVPKTTAATLCGVCLSELDSLFRSNNFDQILKNF